MGVIPKESDDVDAKKEFKVAHAPEIEQPKVEETKEKEVGPVPSDEKWIDMELRTWPEFNEKVLGNKEDKLIIVMFKAKWCRACKQMKQVMSRFKKKHGENIIFGGVDFNYNSGTVRNQKVTSLPTFVFYKSGEEVFRISGIKKKEIEAEIIKLK